MHPIFDRNGGVLFLVVLAISLFAWVSCAQDDALEDISSIEAVKASIAWDAGPIKVVLGNGQGVIADAVVAFTASGDIPDVSIVATTTVAGFMDISPTHFDTVLAGVPYSLTIKFTVPPDAVAGRYKGSIQVTSGGLKYNRTLGVTITVDFAGAEITPTTRVITQPTWDDLQYAAPDYSLIEFLAVPEELMFVQAGDVIVSGVTEQTPFGLIKRVVSVGSDGDTPLLLTCTDAALADAFTSASLAITKALSPADAAEGQPPVGGSGPYEFFLPYAGVFHDGDGDPGTLDDQVTIAGDIGFGSEFSFALGIGASAVQSASFTSVTDHTVDMTVDAQVGIASFAGNLDFWSLQMKPLTVWVGWVPVVIVPKLTLRGNLEGDVAAPTQAAMIESSSMTAGATYAGGVWQPVSTFSVASIEGAASPAPGCNVKARVGPGLDLLVYGVLAPGAQPDGYLRTETGSINDPWWKLYGGIEADVGVSTNALDGALADALFPGVIQNESLLAEGGGTAPGEDGFIAGVVRDAVTGVPLAGVHAVAMMASSPEAEGDTIADGTFTLAVPSTDGYTVIFSKEGYLSATYVDISVVAEHTTYIEAVLQIDAAYAGVGSIGGTIVNALTGIGVPGLTVNLREGLNATIGTVVATAPLPTDASGHYSIAGLPAGNYTACAWGTGYHNTYFTVLCLGGMTLDNQDGTITPILPAGQTRIVLTWGEVPEDLDSHLTGPLPDGTRFWLYFYYLYHPEEFLAWDYVNLDHDDTTSFGPETTTIKQQIDGVYRFCVHDFSNANATPTDPSFALSNSGALVRVYRAEGRVAKFAVPPNRSATLWAVFDMSGDTITPLNIMTYDGTVIHP